MNRSLSKLRICKHPLLALVSHHQLCLSHQPARSAVLPKHYRLRNHSHKQPPCRNLSQLHEVHAFNQLCEESLGTQEQEQEQVQASGQVQEQAQGQEQHLYALCSHALTRNQQQPPRELRHMELQLIPMSRSHNYLRPL